MTKQKYTPGVETQPFSGSASIAGAVPIFNAADRNNPAISCLILFSIDDETRKTLAFMSRIFGRFRFQKTAPNRYCL
jgi:hypothetical protein